MKLFDFLFYLVLIFFINVQAATGDRNSTTPQKILDCRFDYSSICHGPGLRFVGPEWDNTIVQYCSSDGGRTGVVIGEVKNFTLKKCDIRNTTTGNGIYLPPDKPTENVALIGNRIVNIVKNGISASEGHIGGSHARLRIAGNNLDNIAIEPMNGLRHGMYIQTPGFLIKNNEINNVMDGNAISIRSSGIVKKNRINGAGKSGISYHNDHPSPQSSILLIEKNRVVNHAQTNSNRKAIHMLINTSKEESVDRIIIRYNSLPAGMDDVEADTDHINTEVYGNYNSY